MSSTAIDLKEYAEQKDLFNRYGRQDIIYVMLDKSIDHLREEVKDLKDEMRDEFKIVKSDMKEMSGDIKELQADMSNVKAAIKVLDSKIDTGFKALEVSNKQGKTLNKWIFGMLVTILLGLAGLGVTVFLSLAN